MSRYRFVDDQKADGFPVAAACTAAGVSTSAYYEWKHAQQAGPRTGQVFEQRLVEQIRQVHVDSRCTYGSPRVTAALRRCGQVVNHKRVERLMRVHGLVGLCRRRWVRTTIPDQRPAPIPDLVGRRFAPGAPNVAWCGDITYIPTGEGWLYLATVLDLGSRRLLGYSMADHMRTGLVADALNAAVATRGGPQQTHGVIFHSDRGAQYGSAGFGELCRRLGVRQSTGRTGVCWDNAVAEAFFATLKKEAVHGRAYPTRAAARRAVFEWAEGWYNRRRLHSALGHRSPIEWEQLGSESTKACA